MIDQTVFYLRCLDRGGMVLLLEAVMDEEKRTESKVAKYPALAYREILDAILDIDIKVLRGIISGNVLRENIVPCPKPLTLEDLNRVDTNEPKPDKDENGSFQIINILDSGIDEGSDNVIYQCLYTRNYKSWKSIDELDESDMDLVDRFHRLNPTKTRYGKNNVSGKLISWDDLEEKDEHIIYAHFFVDDTYSTASCQSPTTNELIAILEDVEFYCSVLDDDDEELERQREFIARVDTGLQEYDIGQRGWEAEYNQDINNRRYLAGGGGPQINQHKLAVWRDNIIPTLYSEFDAIPEAHRDLPFPFPLSEVGYTSVPKLRRQQHATHSSSVVTMYLFEAIALLKYDGRYRFCYTPIARVRNGHQAWALEIFFTELTQSGSKQGGFNTATAGISVQAALNMPYQQQMEAYLTYNRQTRAENSRISDERMGRLREHHENLKEIEKLEKEAEEQLPKLAAIRERRIQLEAERDALLEEQNARRREDIAALGQEVKEAVTGDQRFARQQALNEELRKKLAMEMALNEEMGI